MTNKFAEERAATPLPQFSGLVPATRVDAFLPGQGPRDRGRASSAWFTSNVHLANVFSQVETPEMSRRSGTIVHLHGNGENGTQR